MFPNSIVCPGCIEQQVQITVAKIIQITIFVENFEKTDKYMSSSHQAIVFRKLSHNLEKSLNDSAIL